MHLTAVDIYNIIGGNIYHVARDLIIVWFLAKWITK